MQRWDKKSELGFEFEKALIELEKDNIANVEDNGEKSDWTIPLNMFVV